MMRLISEIIKKSRIKKQWTQDRLAEELNITQSYLSKLESSTKPPGNSLCVKIAEKLEIDKKDLLLKAFKQRNAEEISKYLSSYNPYPKEIPDEVREFLEVYETLDDFDRSKIKDILLFMTEYAKNCS